MIGPGGKVVVGVKGKSGRKSIAVEFNKVKTIEKAWKKLHDEIDNCDVEKVALPLALRDMTVKTDLTTQGEKLDFYDAEQLKFIASRVITNGEATKSE